MIERISLRNFQSHKQSVLELHSGLNVVVGPSDSGKTSILRALQMVVWNKPSGESLISHWAKCAGKVVDDLEVELVVDGHLIRRIRGKGNSCQLDDQLFKAMGGSVPEVVAQLLNVSELNVQNQHDGVFLLSQSGGEIGRRLNKVVHLDKMDRAISEVDSRRRIAAGELKECRARIELLVTAAAELAWVDDAEKLVAEIERSEFERDKVGALVSRLRGVVEQAESVDLSVYDWLPAAEGDVRGLDELSAKSGELTLGVGRLRALVSEIRSVRVDETDYAPAVALVEEIEVQIMKNGAKRTSVGRLESLLHQVRKEQSGSAACAEELDGLEVKFHEEMPDVCPLCGRSG